MKKVLIVAALIVGVLAASTSMAGAERADSRSSAGAAASEAQRGGGLLIRFRLNSRNGEPVAIKRFRFKRLSAECNGGQVVNVAGKIPSIRVKDNNRFSKTLRRATKSVRVRGKVSGDLDTVRGKIRARGAYAGATGCDSGAVGWVAR